jgi:hypothetical protein
LIDEIRRVLSAPIKPIQNIENDSRKIPWRPTGLAALVLLLVLLGVAASQTSQAEKLLQKARTSTAKGGYSQAYAQLDKANLLLVWPATLRRITATKAQSKQFEGYARGMQQANQLIADTKLDEASATLAKIDKTFPEYAKVQALRQIIAEQKTAIASQQKADSSALPGPVLIVGDANCQTSTQAALNLLKAKAPTHYAIVQGSIGIIECVVEGSRTYAAQNPPKFSAASATRNAGTVWYAAVLAHEAGHSKLYRDYKAAHPGQAVPESIWTGEAAEKVCLDAQYDALTKLGATIFELDSVRSALNTQYYNVSQSKQWW